MNCDEIIYPYNNFFYEDCVKIHFKIRHLPISNIDPSIIIPTKKGDIAP